MTISERTLAYGTEAIGALLGVDALYRAESGDPTGLAVLNMDTEGRYAADALGSYSEARLRFEDLRDEAASLPEEDRRVYYDDVCLSTLAFIRWRQAGLPFKSQLTEFLHVPAEAPDQESVDGLRRMLRVFLTEMGYAGDLAEQCAAWEERNRVAPEDVPGVLTALLDEAWEEVWAAEAASSRKPNIVPCGAKQPPRFPKPLVRFWRWRSFCSRL